MQKRKYKPRQAFPNLKSVCDAIGIDNDNANRDMNNGKMKMERKKLIAEEYRIQADNWIKQLLIED